MTADYDEIPVILGETLVLRCAAVGVPIPTITWMKNKRPLQTDDRITISDDGGELVIRDAVPQDVGDYQCVGTSPAGSATAEIMLWGEGGLFVMVEDLKLLISYYRLKLFTSPFTHF